MIPRTIPRFIPHFIFLWAVLLLAASPGLGAPVKPPKPEAPVTVASLLGQAKAATVKGDIELALRLAQAAIVADPARTAPYVALGNIYAQTGQPDFARNYYDAALGIDPVDPPALKALSALDRTSSSTAANAAR
jgi:tetratricopeptide (TPR) repeat protein